MTDEPQPITVPDAALAAYEAKEDALALSWRKARAEHPDDLPASLIAFLEDL